MKKVSILIILCLLIFCLSLTIGSYDLSLSTLYQIITNNSNDPLAINIFYNLRVPRVLMGFFAGIILGLAGAIYQMLFSNPLASPDLTGVASGASFGAALAIVIGAGSVLEKTLGAFVFSLLSLVFVILLVKSTRMYHTSSYILAGIVISALGDAGIMILKYLADPLGELAAIEFWTMGSLASITFDKMMIAVISGLIPMIILFLLNKQILILSLGNENAQYLGINAKKMRIIILVLTTWMVASIIAVTGVISFVGLIAPHIAFLILKKRTGSYYLISGIIGAIIILIGDMFARSLISNLELPLSVLTILFSTPVLVYWMFHQRGQVL